ncbi:unnamed protein product [Meganyctiphanes norvegica]|uniref:PPPDE domain-containing protein n=1 Tax=Meganyctiphanes norvegica TaxID=48144 RepID=A0AAV2SPJ7_MEGNR
MATAANLRPSIVYLSIVLVLMSLSTKVQVSAKCNPKVPGKNEVWLYQFSKGIVSYHTGLGFSDGTNSGYWKFGNGISSLESCRDDSFDKTGTFDRKHFLGYVYKSLSEVQKIVDRLGGKYGEPCSYVNSADDCFTSDNYNFSVWNCNHFTAWLAEELGVWDEYPDTVWAFRNIG